VLPYSQHRFSLPRNVILLGTMNTADRSLALVDFALRRRFNAFPQPCRCGQPGHTGSFLLDDR
jgi:5-methylcytosine-specific restriction endonuclease McrBC GTP-binding regulatory subunit McrB